MSSAPSISLECVSLSALPQSVTLPLIQTPVEALHHAEVIAEQARLRQCVCAHVWTSMLPYELQCPCYNTYDSAWICKNRFSLFPSVRDDG